MENKRIMVIGGTGYIGSEIVGQLLKENYDVSVLARKEGITSVPRMYIGNVLDKSFLNENLNGFDVVIYLAAIVRTFNKSKYGENARGTVNTINAMKENNIQKLIYFSTQKVHIDNTGPYGDSKKISENEVLRSGLDYVILRPNYVYGVDRNNDFFKLARCIKSTGICPVIGTGNSLFQPINKTAVAGITSRLLKNYQSNLVADISGNSTITINQLCCYMRELGDLRFITFHFPIGMLKLCRMLLPFDIEGYDSDMVAKGSCHSYEGYSNFQRDLQGILRLLNSDVGG